jgi:hypothetical protein
VVPHRAGEAAAQVGRGRGPRPGRDRKKGLIEPAYTQTELAVWTQDEAGPYQAIPQPGAHWRPTPGPARHPHEHVRHGTAKLLTLFHPASGQVRVKGVTSAANRHQRGAAPLAGGRADGDPGDGAGAADPDRPDRGGAPLGLGALADGAHRKFTLPERLPPLRLLLILDNLSGHKTPALVLWLVEHGVMPLYTPLSGSWLNMAESLQRILVRRALTGQTPSSPDDLIGCLEATARGWNAEPTPFTWHGKRQLRRERSRHRHHHPLGGSGASARRPVHRRPAAPKHWRRSCQVTH